MPNQCPGAVFVFHEMVINDLYGFDIDILSNVVIVQD